MLDIAIVQDGGTDRWGDPLPPGPPVPIRRPKMWPRDSSESESNVLVEGLAVLIPPRKPVPGPADTVLVGVKIDDDGNVVDGTGEAYEVDGEPAVYYRGGNGPIRGTIVNLTRAS